MLKALDFLGSLKWPSMLAITVVPAVSFLWFWGDFDRAVPMQLYGPELVGDLPVLLTHPADARLSRDPSTPWCLRTCVECMGRILAADLRYGDEMLAPGNWIAATADGVALCADLPTRRLGERFVWLRARGLQSKLSHRAWRLPNPD